MGGYAQASRVIIPLPVAQRTGRGAPKGRRGAAAGSDAGPEKFTSMRGSQPWRTNHARVLRSQPVFAQDKMWPELRARRLGGFSFVRQVPIDR